MSSSHEIPLRIISVYVTYVTITLPPIRQLNRIEIEIYSIEIYPVDCVNKLLNNRGPLDDETRVSKQKGLIQRRFRGNFYHEGLSKQYFFKH